MRLNIEKWEAFLSMTRARPAWLGSQAGISEGLLPPWTPLEVAGRVVRCWGRKYEFKHMPFPYGIRTAGKAVLARAVDLETRVNGRIVGWKPAGFRVAHRSDAWVCLETTCESTALSLEGRVEIEYDGLVKIDHTGEWRLRRRPPGESPTGRCKRS